jgi:hypothetical protein
LELAAELGDRKLALELLDKLATVNKQVRWAGRREVWIASAMARLGDTERAFELLGDAAGRYVPVGLASDPCLSKDFAELREDPRFATLFPRCRP